MRRKLGLGLLIFLAVLGVAGAGAYFWIKTRLWTEIQAQARAYGAELQKPGLAIRWAGGLRFTLRLTDLTGELKEPLPITGRFTLPLLEVDAELTDERRRAVVHHLLLQGLSGSFHRAAPPAEPPAPATDEGLEIPKIEVPEFERPELPLAVELRDARIATGELSFRQTGEDGALEARLSGLQLQLTAAADAARTEFTGELTLAPLTVRQTSAAANAEADLQSLRLQFASQSPTERPLLIQPKADAAVAWSRLAYTKRPADGAPLEIADQGGELRARADGAHVDVRGQGRNLRATMLKKPTDWSFELQPVAQTERERAYRLTAAVPGLLDLRLNLKVPASFDPARPELKADGQISAHSDLSLLVLDENPSPWKSKIDGKFTARLARAGDLALQTQLRGDGLSLDLQAELNPRTQEAQASGFVSLDFKGRNFRYAGLHPRGRVSAPFKLLLRQRRKFFVDSELRLQAFSLASPDLQVEAVRGALPVKQAWAFRDGRWELSPRLSPNAFGRADFDSFEPLETRLNQLQIDKVTYQKRVYGPVALDLRFEQNLLRSGSWSAQVGDGAIEGALQADLSLDNPRLGLLMRAFDVKLEELLPASMFRSALRSERGLSFRLGMDWDLGKATAVGRLDWSNIDSAQVLQVLDFLDPQFENATFNQARMVLAQAYPTRVQVEMRGPVADIRIGTNLVNLPEVRNVAISPYLVKANEALYSSELYRNLRSTGTPAERKEP